MATVPHGLTVYPDCLTGVWSHVDESLIVHRGVP
jgi:hypothetical protein